MSYAGGTGSTAVITRTAPRDGFRGRGQSNPSGHRSLITSPLPYRQEDSGEVDGGIGARYAEEVGGIVPGYKGHVPRAHHVYGRSVHGDPHGLSHAGELRKQSTGRLERGAEDAFASGFRNGVGIDGQRQARRPDTKADHGIWSEGLPDYSVQVGGVVPGYRGHVPRAIHKYGASAVGNTPQFNSSPEHREVAELRQMFTRSPEVRSPEHGYPRTDPNDDGEAWWPRSAPLSAIEGRMVPYRDEVNGVLPKYAGHVPRGKDVYGTSHYGHVRTVAGEVRESSNSGVRTEGVTMGQVRRENTKAEVPFDPLRQRHDGNGVIPGYRGHVPNAANAVGMTTFLSGKGYTEIDHVHMAKAGGLGDLGDSAAAYGCNDWGASAFTDGRAEALHAAAAGAADARGLGAIVRDLDGRHGAQARADGQRMQRPLADGMGERAAGARAWAAADAQRQESIRRAVRG